MPSRYGGITGTEQIANDYENINIAFENVEADVDAKAATVNTHIANNTIHVTQADHDKLNGIEAGAEVNQNAFSRVNGMDSESPTDEFTIVGDVGIDVTQNPNDKSIHLTVTGESAPGPHAATHLTGGSDPIPYATPTTSGLMPPESFQAIEDNADAIADVTAQLAEKANQTDLESGLSLKADKTYVDSELSEKADQSYVNTQLANIVGGSPKGAYATLAALQAAYPSGAAGVYVVEADGNWYYWNGTSWTAGGVYQSTGIIDGSVTPTKIQDATLVTGGSENLLDPFSVTMGYFVDENNGVVTSTTFAGVYCSDYIAVNPNTSYTFRAILNQSGAWFDSNKNYISPLAAGTITSPTTVTSPAAASYVRWNGDSGTPPGNTMIVAGGVYPSSYIPFVPKKYGLKWLGLSKWAGKKIVTFGDSITWYDGRNYIANTTEPGVLVKGYQTYMREELGATVINQGHNAYTTPQLNSAIQSYDLTGVDAVTILTGTNDFRDIATEEIGNIQPIGGPFDSTTFVGAYQAAVEHILATYPEVKLYLLTPIKAWTDANGLMPDAYPNAVVELGKLYSLSVCDLYHESGINDLTKSVFLVDTDAVAFDFHPSTKGYARVANILIPFLENN